MSAMRSQSSFDSIYGIIYIESVTFLSVVLFLEIFDCIVVLL